MSKQTVQSSDNKDNINLNNSINKNEIKFLDNKTDKKFTNDIDKLNESLYKINNFLKLTKDIDEMKRDSLVKNDIQRKLSLKSQWLNTSHGSTTSLNSLPNFDRKSSASESSENMSAARRGKENIDVDDVNALSGSIQSLDTCAAAANIAANRRANFLNHKAASIQNLNVATERRKRFLENKDELNFIHSLDITDQEIDALRRQPDFGGPKFWFKNSSERLSDSMKKIELQSFSDTMKCMEAQNTGPKVSLSGSQRDLSKYFPKKADPIQAKNVNLNQKELKDVDLTKYFAPSPVQERKSLPSPGQSPSLPRKGLTDEPKKPPIGIAKQVILREAFTKAGGATSDESVKKKSNESIGHKEAKSEAKIVNKIDSKPKEDFNIFDQQMDGAVTLRKHNKPKIVEPERKSQKTNGRYGLLLDADNDEERSASREYSQLFGSDKTPAEDIDELFDKVAAKLVPELPKSIDDKKRKSGNLDATADQTKKKIKSKVPKAIVIKKPPKQIVAPKTASIWSKVVIDEDKRDAFILSKLSSNLIDEIKLLEQQLEIAPDEPKEKKEKKPPARKSKLLPKGTVSAAKQASDENQFNEKCKTAAVNGTPVEKRRTTETVKPPIEHRKSAGSLYGSDLDNAFDDIFKTVEIQPPPRKKSAKAKKLAEEKARLANATNENINQTEPNDAARKNSITYDVPLSNPPGSRKNSASSVTIKPPIAEQPKKNIHDLKIGIPDNIQIDHKVVVAKPPRSRKNSTAESPTPKADDSKSPSDRGTTTKNSKTQGTYRNGAEPSAWNLNGAYEPKTPDRKYPIEFSDEGVDTVDKKDVPNSVFNFERTSLCEKSLPNNDFKETRPTTPLSPALTPTESKKIPPPKPIRRNKSGSSIDRPSGEREEDKQRKISLNEKQVQSRTAEPLSKSFNKSSDDTKLDSNIEYRNNGRDSTQYYKTPEKGIRNSQLRKHKNDYDELDNTDGFDRRGVNLSEWSKRREARDPYKTKPEEIVPDDRILTGYIPHDNLRHRQNNLSYIVNESRPNNDLTGLLNSLATTPNNNSPNGKDPTYSRSPIDHRYDSNITTNGSNNSSSHSHLDYKYPTRGIYDNIPADEDITKSYEQIPSATCDSVYNQSSSSRRPISNEFDYDNLSDQNSDKPLKWSYRPIDSTERLLERSKIIHNRKQDFMNDQISGNNPYLQRMFKRDSNEFSPPTTPTALTSHKYDYNPRNYEEPITDYKSTITHANSKLTKAPSTFSLTKRRGSNNSISSTKRSVLNLFRGSPEKTKERNKDKDKDAGCSVS